MYFGKNNESYVEEFSCRTPDVFVEKIINQGGEICYNIIVNDRTIESGLTEYEIDDELGSESWRKDVIIIDNRDEDREDQKDPCDFCSKKIYDCVDCENNLFNKILNSN